MRNFILAVFIGLITIHISTAQQPKKPTASDIYESIQKLNFLGSVLYVAAHPDDENTRLISYFSNNVKARTAYLSLTRGDGGQNLIGPEIRELLGVIRTQELLAARSIDGGEQMFSRANDFGYSKHPDETLAIWNKEEVLSDVVRAIRKFKPDVIINRFDHRSPGSTHGHHTSSAMLSFEAFNLANDPNVYSKQLDDFTTWQPKRLFFNTSWWFYGSQEKFEKADKSKMLGIDVGVYYPDLGLSNTEIAAMSRSQHKSQGFGTTGTRGIEMEYLELIKGKMPADKSNIFEGIDTSWNRIKGGQAIGKILIEVEHSFNFTDPSASLPKLVEAYQLINNLEDSYWRDLKSDEIKDIIAACAGLYLEAVAETDSATKNEYVPVKLEIINRSNANITLQSFINANDKATQKNVNLNSNQDFHFQDTLKINGNQRTTAPYWLREKGTLGMYKVDDPNFIGLPETPSYFDMTFNLLIEGVSMSFKKAVVYKRNDPVKGEIYKPFSIIPLVSSKIDEKVIIFNSDNPKTITVTVKAGRDNLNGTVKIEHPKNWTITPALHNVSIRYKAEDQHFNFEVTPPSKQNEAWIHPIVTIDGKDYSQQLIEIDYEHIPYQTVLLPNDSKVVRLNIVKKGNTIGYIEGAGDVVPESLKQLGYDVITINPEDITPAYLDRFDAIVLGIRAYNTVDALKFKQQQLFDYVNRGGNLIVQYNTSFRLKVDQVAPYPLELSRDRVTDENAKVKFLAPNHPILNSPNIITEKDFEGWTQERGLYFPDNWDKAFTPILSMKDEGESSKSGSLLVAQYGKGYYIYTGLSFFREFPEGVSGAYRLFSNMLSIGRDDNNLNKKQND
ncbi:PIG-L family deacetylase [Mangrovimonas aestuarii]|uniref:PIG-L family deacetylase n=1 Tax=Mangrovimonas aestuarii TaxID=3018443 RepID=UPI0023791B4C|nr:PIG-L family deacetylase [Mangrovimonas aestuarii]